MNYLIAAVSFAAIPLIIFVSVYFLSKFTDWTHSLPEHVGAAMFMSVAFPGAFAIVGLLLVLLIFGVSSINAG